MSTSFSIEEDVSIFAEMPAEYCTPCTAPSLRQLVIFVDVTAYATIPAAYEAVVLAVTFTLEMQLSIVVVVALATKPATYCPPLTSPSTVRLRKVALVV